jgi:hypothetical protein
MKAILPFGFFFALAALASGQTNESPVLHRVARQVIPSENQSVSTSEPAMPNPHNLSSEQVVQYLSQALGTDLDIVSVSSQQGFAPAGVPPAAAVQQEVCNTCSEASNDLPNGTLLYCDNFQDYTTGGLDAQSARWRRWDPPSGDGQVVQEGNGNKYARFNGTNNPDPDMLYLFDNQTSGRYRISWRMYIPVGKSAYYNILHQSPLTNGLGSNFG